MSSVLADWILSLFLSKFLFILRFLSSFFYWIFLNVAYVRASFSKRSPANYIQTEQDNCFAECLLLGDGQHETWTLWKPIGINEQDTLTNKRSSFINRILKIKNSNEVNKFRDQVNFNLFNFSYKDWVYIKSPIVSFY